jgi:Concanavalin A-like lectin/glucanases superfamily
MAFGNGPKIVTDGLVLALDASDKNSYISGSLTWKDLSGNGYNGTFIQSASFNDINGGTISFNGITSSVSVTTKVLQDSGGSINTWVYPIARNPISAGYILSAFGSNSDRFYITSNDNFTTTRGNPASTVTFTNSVTFNQWYNLTSTWVSSSLGSSLSAYLNGVLVGSTPITASGSTTVFYIGGFSNTGGSQSFSGSIALTQIYNKPLSATEVLQNYNALKSRFNLT